MLKVRESQANGVGHSAPQRVSPAFRLPGTGKHRVTTAQHRALDPAGGGGPLPRPGDRQRLGPHRTPSEPGTVGRPCSCRLFLPWGSRSSRLVLLRASFLPTPRTPPGVPSCSETTLISRTGCSHLLHETSPSPAHRWPPSQPKHRPHCSGLHSPSCLRAPPSQ